jgi:hypothetical protein
MSPFFHRLCHRFFAEKVETHVIHDGFPRPAQDACRVFFVDFTQKGFGMIFPETEILFLAFDMQEAPCRVK